MNPIELSQQLLYAVKTGSSFDHFTEALAGKSEEELYADLKETNARKAFWINLYNSFVQLLIVQYHPDFSTWKSRMKFFSNRCIHISNQLLSLNDIEHGMLRHSSVWWSLGYLQKLMVNGFEKKFRVPLDYRIHFALNCGAISCPAIAFYSAEKLEEELDDAMKSFLEEDVKFDKHNSTVHISSIFNWYRGDFGGRKGIVNLLRSQQLIPADRKIKIHFKPYDWTTMTAKFSGLEL